MSANNACASVAPGPSTSPVNPLATNAAPTLMTPATMPITSTSVGGGNCNGGGSRGDGTPPAIAVNLSPQPPPPFQPQAAQSLTSAATSSATASAYSSDFILAPTATTTSTTAATTTTTATTDTNLTETTTTTAVAPYISATKSTNNDDNSKTDYIGPIVKRAKARPAPFSKPILLSAERRNRPKKRITWKCDDQIQRVHYFEMIPDERVNVTHNLNNQSNFAVDNSAALSGAPPGSSPNAHANRLDQASLALAAAEARNEASARSHDGFKRREWRLISIDYNHDLPGPGWNSVERSAQAERENYVLGALDLPGQPATLDEPDANESSATVMRNEQGVKIIPLENPEGMCTVYPDLSNSEIVNGVRVPPPNTFTYLYDWQTCWPVQPVPQWFPGPQRL